MSRIVVVGGGFGGLACAARLAKLGHEVTLVEASDSLGGAMTRRSLDGYTWDAGPSYTLLPAVVRDLFRKSGRPLEKEVDLEPLEIIREHRFEDDTVLRLPGGSRAGQGRAFDELDEGLGEEWLDYVDSFARDWEVLRQGYFEHPWRPDALSKDVAARLDSRETMHKRLRRTFRDDRLRSVAAHPFAADGHDPRNVPAWAGLVAYLEQRFGVWTTRNGMAAITDALVERLTTRGVRVVTGVEVRDVVMREGRAVGVRTDDGVVDADLVVCAIDPRRLPTMAPSVVRSMPAIPAVTVHLGLQGEVPDLTHEVVLHGDPMLILRPGGTAPEGCTAWTVLGRGQLAEDALLAMSRLGTDVRDNVVTRLDLTPRELVLDWHGSPLGLLWQGRATVRHRLGPRTPFAGVYAAGAHATPGSGLAYVGLSAALVAEEIGPA